jgi:hypothetical protein
MRVIAHASMPRGCSRPFMRIAMATKTVIVEFQSHSRIVSFQESENEMENATAAVEEVFRDVFSSPPSPFFLQIWNDTFNRHVDVSRGQPIPDKSVLRVVLKEVQVSYLLKVYNPGSKPHSRSNCTPPPPTKMQPLLIIT